MHNEGVAHKNVPQAFGGPSEHDEAPPERGFRASAPKRTRTSTGY